MKKIVIPIVIFLVILIGVVGYVFYNNKTVSTITLDINPSIQIDLNRKGYVKKIIPLNDDAVDIVNGINEKSLDGVLDILVDRIISNIYLNDEPLIVLLYSSGNVSNVSLEEDVRKKISTKDVPTEVIVIDNVTSDDLDLAKKYNISSAKAHYINSITEKTGVSTELLIDKSIEDLRETKDSGNYCDNGYTLEGDFCLKEISSYPASDGSVCPRGYNEYDGKCYREGGIFDTGKLSCDDGFSLSGEECVMTFTITAQPQYSCSVGELKRKSDVSPIGGPDNDKYYCIDTSNAVAPTLRCLIGPHMIINGSCYVGPAPTIDGGCPNNDTLVNGGCYSLDPGDQYQCPNGGIYEKSKDTFVEFCPDTINYIEPTISGYTCPDNLTLKNDTCVKEERRDPIREHACENGFTLVNDRCINFNDVSSYVDGYKCEGEARTVGNRCVIYEVVEAYHN